MGDAVFETLGDNPSLSAFWRPSFHRFAAWFAASEPARRANVTGSFAEVCGALTLPSGFRLTARADRIDTTDSGAVVIYDYKTGAPPNQGHVAELYRPQLPLEAAIAQGGGFGELGRRDVGGLAYIHILGRGDGGAEQAASKVNPSVLAELALEQLEALIARYNNAETPYEVKRRANAAFAPAYRFDAYAHLARVAEWLTEGEGT
jgi:ATP-dependent helicase/nuclease subunit B